MKPCIVIWVVDYDVRILGKCFQRCIIFYMLLLVTGCTFKWWTAAVLSRLSHRVYSIHGWNEDEKKKVEDDCRRWIADDTLQARYFHSDEDKQSGEKKTDNAALVVVSSAAIFLVFRGTDSIINCGQNLRMTCRPFPIFSGAEDRIDQAGKVHTGFLTAQNSLWSKLIAQGSPFSADSLDDTKSEATPRKSLFIGGHSLGGAMAIITAARLASEGAIERIDGVYTFGSPALFDRYATERYNEHPVLMGRTFRVEFNGDLVTNILPWCCFLHPGSSIRINERDGRTIPDGWRDDACCCIPRCRCCCFFFTCCKAHRVRKSYSPTTDSIAYALDPVGTPESRTAQLAKRRAIKQSQVVSGVMAAEIMDSSRAMPAEATIDHRSENLREQLSEWGSRRRLTFDTQPRMMTMDCKLASRNHFS